MRLLTVTVFFRLDIKKDGTKDRILRELARRSLPTDMAGTLCLAFSFVNLSVSFCLVNLNSAQVNGYWKRKDINRDHRSHINRNKAEPEPGSPPTPIHTNAEKYYKIMVDSTSIGLPGLNYVTTLPNFAHFVLYTQNS